MQIDLTHHTAIVTGASGQLGRVMARTLASCGADVAVHYHRDAENVEKVRRDIVAMGRKAVAVQADITDAESVNHMKAIVQENLV